MLKKKKILSILCAFFLIFSLQIRAFSPRNEKIFAKNCLRLLKNGEYSLLEAYFLRYFEHISPKIKEKEENKAKKKQNLRKKNYLLTILEETPIPKIKKKIIRHALKINPHLDTLHCYLGEQSLAEKKYAQAEKSYLSCPNTRKFFFLAQIAKAQGKKEKALELYRDLLKKTKEKRLVNESLLEMAFLYNDLLQYQKSIDTAAATPDGVTKSIILYQAYFNNGNTELAQKEWEKINEKYPLTIEAKAFLYRWQNKIITP